MFCEPSSSNKAIIMLHEQGLLISSPLQQTLHIVSVINCTKYLMSLSIHFRTNFNNSSGMCCPLTGVLKPSPTLHSHGRCSERSGGWLFIPLCVHTPYHWVCSNSPVKYGVTWMKFCQNKRRTADVPSFIVRCSIAKCVMQYITH